MSTNAALRRYKQRLEEIKRDLGEKKGQYVGQGVVLEVERIVHALNLSFGGLLPGFSTQEFYSVTVPSTGEPYYYRIPLIGRLSHYLAILEAPVKPGAELIEQRRGPRTADAAARSHWAIMHAEIRRVAKKRFEDGHFADAVLAAIKKVNTKVNHLVKTKKGLDLDGVELMQHAFSPKNPIIILDDLSTETGRNIQQGYMEMFAGAIRAVRNPIAHTSVRLSSEKALHFLMLASLLMYRLDDTLGGELKKLRKVYEEHNSESARNWSAEQQCQCDQCKMYRSLSTSKGETN